MMEELTVYKIEKEGEIRMACQFEIGGEAERIVRAIPGRLWSRSLKCWHLPYSALVWQELKNKCKDKIFLIADKSGPRHQTEGGRKDRKPEEDGEEIQPFKANRKVSFGDSQLLEKYKMMLELKKYSSSTIAAYVPFFHDFIVYFGRLGKEPSQLSYNEIYGYVHQLCVNNGETHNKQMICAIKFYYEKILGQDRMFFNRGSKHTIEILPILFEFKEMQSFTGEHFLNPGRELLLWLVFYLGFDSAEISRLSIQILPELEKKERYVSNSMAAFHMDTLVGKHLALTRNSQFLYEKGGLPFSEIEMQQFIWWIIERYKIEAVFRKQIWNLMAQAQLIKSTKEQYESYLLFFIRGIGYRNPATVSNDELNNFLHQFGKEKGSDSVNGMITALRFYFRYCWKRDFMPYELPRARRALVKPQVLSLDEISAILSAIENDKQRLLISIIYSAGLRRSEVRNLRITDLDFDRGLIFIKAAKGKKDRYTILSKSLEESIREYIALYRPLRYVFEGEKIGEPYSFTSMEIILKRAALRSGIGKQVNLHLLRHSFATHVLEDGYDTRYLQQVLGHNSIKTTERYTHLTKDSVLRIRSPFDKLFSKRKRNRDLPEY